MDRTTALCVPKIEAALGKPGKEAIRALPALRRDIPPLISSLLPAEGLDALTETRIPQAGVPLADRRRLLDVATEIRRFDLFRSLSIAEATVLSTMLERRHIAAGTLIAREGETADSLYLIVDGEAELCGEPRESASVVFERLRPGDYFGEIGLLLGGPYAANVRTVAPTTVLRLSREIYEQYLHPLADVERQLALIAARRATQPLRWAARRAAPRQGVAPMDWAGQSSMGQTEPPCTADTPTQAVAPHEAA
jgi:CRP-like cAMP-binding protein